MGVPAVGGGRFWARSDPPLQDMSEPKYFRSLDDVNEDFIFAFSGLEVGPDSRRILALADVLRRLRDVDYQALTDRADSFRVFVPPVDLRGSIYPFVARSTLSDVAGPEVASGSVRLRAQFEEKPKVTMHARVVYLGPALENDPFAVIVAVAARLVAHLTFDDPLIYRPDRKDELGRAADDMVEAWGFGPELEALRTAS